MVESKEGRTTQGKRKNYKDRKTKQMQKRFDSYINIYINTYTDEFLGNINSR